MELTIEELENGVTKATLVGRLDIEGAQAVDMRFNVLAGSKKALVVDLSGVTFLASMGLRTLLVAGRAIAVKGGRMALAGPQENVMRVLTTSGADEVVAVTDTVAAAIAAVRG
jgi:anti-sigma B factor antagonist